MSADERILKLGLPKGSLEKPTFDLFEKAGYDIQGASRSYRPQIDDSELRARLLRAQEIGRYVHKAFSTAASLAKTGWLRMKPMWRSSAIFHTAERPPIPHVGCSLSRKIRQSKT